MSLKNWTSYKKSNIVSEKAIDLRQPIDNLIPSAEKSHKRISARTLSIRSNRLVTNSSQMYMSQRSNIAIKPIFPSW